MKTEVRFRSLSQAAELRAYAKRQLDFHLSRFSSAVDDLVLRLDDLNGPRGGIDKRCQIVARLRSGVTITLSAESSDAETAIDQAITRAVRKLVRELSRSRNWGATG